MNRLAILASASWALAHYAFSTLTARALDRSDSRERAEAEFAAKRQDLAAAVRVPAVRGGLAILPIQGVIGPRTSGDHWYADVGMESLVRVLDQLAADPQVGAVLLSFDTPGGNVEGVPEAAARIRAFREQKPIYGIANFESFSAGYYLLAQCTKAYCAPSGGVGSIGVWRQHLDVSKWEEELGVKTTLVSAGKYKVEGHPWAPLEGEALARWQEEVNAHYDRFVADVAQGRGLKATEVRGGCGQGRCLTPAEALSEKMIEGIISFEDLIAKLAPAGSATAGNSVSRGRRLADAEIALTEAE